MKKMVSIFLAASTPFLVSAQNGSSTYIDKEIFNVCASIVVIGLLMVFTLAMVQRILDNRLKNKIVDKGMPENTGLPFFKANPAEHREASIKLMLIFAGLGVAFTLIHYTLPLGFHSLAIMAFCIAASFLGYYFFLKKSTR